MARVSGGRPAETAAPAIRDAVHATDPQSPVSFEKTFDEVIQETFARPRESSRRAACITVVSLKVSWPTVARRATS
ncbi:MAG: hypothetical protein HYS05_14095 [Acidobacteria bacterium]|nr:hypothetical protein [Acidobacteriota bacterium]